MARGKWELVAVYREGYRHGAETIILYRHSSGALKTKRIDGAWTKAQIEGKR